MSNYILVHGGNMSSDSWNELTGRADYKPGIQLAEKVWTPIVNELTKKNHRVFAPALLDEYEYGLSDHIEQIKKMIIDNDLQDVILVGHSYGGMVITGVASEMSDSIKQLYYIDAALPEPNQSLIDFLKLGGVDMQAIMEGMPKAYTQKIIFDSDKINAIDKTYVLCTESEFSSVSKLAVEKIKQLNGKWEMVELHTSHVPMATATGELLALL